MADEPSTAAHERDVSAHLVDPNLTLDDRVLIAGRDGHHLRRVRRLRVDESLTVSDGSGTWRRYRVASIAGEGLHLEATDTARAETGERTDRPRLTVAPGLSKGTKLETICAQLTEIGVAAIAPVVLDRSVIRLDPEGARRSSERLREVVRQAAMQSRRSRLPELRAIESFAAFLARVDSEALFHAELSGGRLGLADARASARAAIVTGPEGGFSPEEIDLLGGHSSQPIGLGPYVLRAETAPLAAASAVLN